MLKFSGKSAMQGIAIGEIYSFCNCSPEIPQREILDKEIDSEIIRLKDGRETVIGQLKQLYEEALIHTGKEQAEIFEAHQLMLADEDFIECMITGIREQKKNAEYAVYCAGEEYAELFASMDNEYMRARAADIRDITEKTIRALLQVKDSKIDSKEPVIVLAKDLTPSETLQMDKTKVLAFLTQQGSVNSHTAILARSMEIPSLIGVDIKNIEEYDKKIAIVDGFEGIVYIDPTSQVMQEMREKQRQYQEQKEALVQMIGKESITRDGQKINLYANIGNPKDIDKVLQNDGEGIGLFRSEFLYMESRDYPKEEEQFLAYKEVAERMNGKKVIIRTLDIGADKQVDYFGLEKEENPAMGYRAIRICLDRTDIFKTQLRAIYRAAAFGNVSVMFPMIVSLSEIQRAKEIVEEVKRELEREKLPYGNVETGIMIETPAAVMISDQLAKEVDFFSIGTNDLTQYTLAADRQNPCLGNLYDSRHEAVLRMIRMTVENGHKGGIWVGICGELASDETLTESFADMGIDELSVSPAYLLSLRKKIREI